MDVTSESQVAAGAVAVQEPPVVPVDGMTNGAAEGEDTPVLSLMEQFLNDPSLDYKSLKYGDVMDGIIMRLDRDEILVDIGSKSEGVVPSREFSSLTNEERNALEMGETILVFVVQPENLEGQAVVSIDRARQEKSWRRLQEIFDANDVIEAEVTNYNKGGLLVNLDGVRGFVPASQVSEIRGGDEASKQADMARMIGSSLPLKVIEINRHRNRLILSERQAVQERRDVMKEQLIQELKEGEVRKGRVSSICDFGAFVDIGGADGLVHLSELSWSRVRHPSEILRIGQEVEVFVLGINPQERKIALSLKRTQAEPWSQVGDKYEVGQLVRGQITQLANFGAFARIEDGIEGLIHVSELTDERIVHPKQVVKEGDELLLRIIRIDPQRRRMGLSLRRALDTPDAELQAAFGEEILEERDRIVAALRAALEAEGIEIGSGRSAEEDDAERAQRSEASADGRSSGDARGEAGSATMTAYETPPSAASTFVMPTPQAPREQATRPARPQAPQIDTSGMNAMEAAFALAEAAAAEAEADAAEALLNPQPETAAVAEPADAAEATDATAEAAVEPLAAEVETTIGVEPDADTAPEPPTAQDALGEEEADVSDAPAGSIAELEGDPEMSPANAEDVGPAVVDETPADEMLADESVVEDPVVEPSTETDVVEGNDPLADAPTEPTPGQAGDSAIDTTMDNQAPLTDEQAASAGDPVLEDDSGTR